MATVDDAADEADGSVTAALAAGTGYTVSASQGAATVAVADNDDAPSVNPHAALIAKIYGWRNNNAEWSSNKEHTDRWDRALLAFGESVADASLTPMTAAEAQAFANRGWTPWVEVAAALTQIEGGGTQTPTTTPELSIAAGAAVAEGGGATFTIIGEPGACGGAHGRCDGEPERRLRRPGRDRLADGDGADRWDGDVHGGDGG